MLRHPLGVDFAKIRKKSERPFVLNQFFYFWCKISVKPENGLVQISPDGYYKGNEWAVHYTKSDTQISIIGIVFVNIQPRISIK